MRTEIVVNRDNAHLGPLCGPGFIIGKVDEVNGPEAVEMPEFVPTRHELLELARYWQDIYYHYVTLMWANQQTCSSWIRLTAFAQRRVDRIAMMVGGDALNKIIEALNEKYRSELGDEAWQRYCDGQDPPQEWLDALDEDKASYGANEDGSSD